MINGEGGLINGVAVLKLMSEAVVTGKVETRCMHRLVRIIFCLFGTSGIDRAQSICKYIRVNAKCSYASSNTHPPWSCLEQNDVDPSHVEFYVERRPRRAVL